ncbi:MAG: histidine phosphatase family protein [Solirubrobacteraceae bacterium]|mgnify:CR=1 FL=1|nr:histidine phosphatase family protein [Solirubrobacteraceae bacterium]
MSHPEEVGQRRFQPPPDATEILVLRHGASAPVAPGMLHELTPDGWGDPDLAPEGVEQAERLARRLELERIDAIFVTTLRRTVQTAAPTVARTGIEPVVVPELAEVHLGEWEGGEYRLRARRGDPLVLRALREERWDVIPGAEPAEAFAQRVRRGIERVVELTGPGRTAAAFVHAGVIGEICRQATSSRRFAFVHADNASLTKLVVFADGRWLLRSFNETTHLD